MRFLRCEPHLVSQADAASFYVVALNIEGSEAQPPARAWNAPFAQYHFFKIIRGKEVSNAMHASRWIGGFRTKGPYSAVARVDVRYAEYIEAQCVRRDVSHFSAQRSDLAPLDED